jgi:hypothetical protein
LLGAALKSGGFWSAAFFMGGRRTKAWGSCCQFLPHFRRWIAGVPVENLVVYLLLEMKIPDGKYLRTPCGVGQLYTFRIVTFLAELTP